MFLVVTLGGCSGRTRWSSCWIAALLILLLQWLYPRVPWSHVLSRMFYGHLTLSRDLAYSVPILLMSLLHCILGGFRLRAQMRGRPFPIRGSHNIMITEHLLLNFYPMCNYVQIIIIHHIFQNFYFFGVYLSN